MEFPRLLLISCLPAVWLLAAAAAAARSPGCATSCGDIDVPYPFGLDDPQCAINTGFQLNCTTTTTVGGGTTPTLLYKNAEVTNISVPDGKLWLKTIISRQCYNHTTNQTISDNAWINLAGSPYVLSADDNKVIVLGCRSMAYMLSDSHGGLLLFEEMKSQQGVAFKIFSEEELQQATNKFDEHQVLGHGGHGTVYKGLLKGDIEIAVKRCMAIDEQHKKEFGKEMLILSQINHKNIVKLLGCCLEVEVPMLVYEFIPNGTLFHLIHQNHTRHISLGTRLRIAYESAEALSYLHSCASPPILHGDVKSTNILLDGDYTAKENKLEDILDDQIKNNENIEYLEEIADLARQCLEMSGINRPSMKEVADKLDRMRKIMQHPWAHGNPEELDRDTATEEGRPEAVQSTPPPIPASLTRAEVVTSSAFSLLPSATNQVRKNISSAMAFSPLLLLLLLLPLMLAASAADVPVAARRPGCATRCGDIEVPYPFGLDPQCAINAAFRLNCSTVGRATKLFHGTLEVIRFSVPDGKAWLKTWISRQCYDQATATVFADNAWMDINNLPYVLSADDNKVIVLGCRSLAYMLSDTVERRRLHQIKQRYFRQHGGLLLFEEMKSQQGVAFKIFSEEELQQATNKFDEHQVLGHGGHGTVYKGVLKSYTEIAVKRCMTIDEQHKKEFGKEMLILSQINHKNIVKLLGCCLEVEVPMLVYEFIPNGTLFDLIHRNHTRHISLDTRLRIAYESAEALSYLHSCASPPILHGDVKSTNILLDGDYTAKENKVEDILDDQIKNNESIEYLEEIADLARQCLEMSGINRPSMKEVADKLDRLRKIMQHPWAHDNPEELDRLLGESPLVNSTSTTGNFSITKKAAMGLELGR
ncbi:hypothetical protein HU200_037961 [Digitaria exilis]|uniref:Protein kinase domain-containing protein n=1 Tax=Digitaria exilis TaxID=1010633 RepID=A0A835BDV7_9POAL|nr:hypothetical protein HU200_037961 [Digitaria exilis]